jgi:hypothetical protein
MGIIDYAFLDYPDNASIKNVLKQVIDILNKNNIHYWADFSTLSKITTEKENKFLFYLNSFEISIFEEDRNRFFDLLNANQIRVWNNITYKIDVCSKDLFVLENGESRFRFLEPTKEPMLKWVNIWCYKSENADTVSLQMINDFKYNKKLFTNTEEIEYCGLKIKIPKKHEEINKIRFPHATGNILCRSPKKRENCERDYGFCNLGNYK